MEINLDNVLKNNQQSFSDIKQILNEYNNINSGAQKLIDLFIYHSIIKLTKPKKILEFGCADGLTTSIIIDSVLKNNLKCELVAFDIFKKHADYAKEKFNKYDFVKILEHDYKSPLPFEFKDIDIVFIDADHRKEESYLVWDFIKNNLNNNFSLFIHDVGFSGSSKNQLGIASLYNEWEGWLDIFKNNNVNICPLGSIVEKTEFKNIQEQSLALDADSRAFIWHDISFNNTSLSMFISNCLNIV